MSSINYEAVAVVLMQLAKDAMSISTRNMRRLKDPQLDGPIITEREVAGRIAVIHLLNSLSDVLLASADGMEKIQQESLARSVETDVESGMLVPVTQVGEYTLYRKSTPSGVQYWTHVVGARLLLWDPSVVPRELIEEMLFAEAERTK